MTEIKLSGKIKQILTRNLNDKFFYIYQFETIDNNDYLEIVDVYSKDKIDDFTIDSCIEIPITISLRNNSILFELKIKNIIKD